jgi:hypothetical protein
MSLLHQQATIILVLLHSLRWDSIKGNHNFIKQPYPNTFQERLSCVTNGLWEGVLEAIGKDFKSFCSPSQTCCNIVQPNFSDGTLGGHLGSEADYWACETLFMIHSLEKPSLDLQGTSNFYPGTYVMTPGIKIYPCSPFGMLYWQVVIFLSHNNLWGCMVVRH